MTARVCLLGFTVPDSARDEIMATDRQQPAQTHNLAWALVAALRSAGLEVTLLSTWPVSDFPRNPRVVFRSASFTAHGVMGRCLGFVNLTALKHATRLLQCLVQGTAALRRWRTSILVVHGVHSPFLWYAVLSRRWLGLTTVVVLTDPPGVVLPSDGRLRRLLKRLDVTIVRRALRLVDAVIALTSALAEDLAPGRPVLVVDGIAGPMASRTAGAAASGRTRPLAIYAGSLRAGYGVDRLVDAVRGQHDPPVTVAIYGSGDLADWVRAVAEDQQHVEGPQLLSRDELLTAYRAADLLVQPRPSDQDFVRYSFPSKLIEYMASGTPVLTTRVVGSADEYDSYVYWIDDDTVAGFRAALDEVVRIPEPERLDRGRRAAEFIRRTRSPQAQGRRIADFFAELGEGSTLPLDTTSRLRAGTGPSRCAQEPRRG